jgi:hypothetical protein
MPPDEAHEDFESDEEFEPGEEYFDYVAEEMRRFGEVEAWFAERGYAVRYGEVDEGAGFEVLVMSPDTRVGSAVAVGVAGELSEAAENARADFLAAHGGTVTGVAEPSGREEHSSALTTRGNPAMRR